MTKSNTEQCTIKPINLETMQVCIRGIAPLVVARFSKKAELMAKMAEGPSAKNKRTRTARDYDLEAQEAKHTSKEGWEGISAAAFRAACISACRLCGFKMTMAKLSLFIVADGTDRDEMSPLVRLYGDPAETYTAHTRNATGVIDIRSRPMYQRWGCVLNIRFDRDQFTPTDVINLINRAGLQVGVCEGRPDSKSSAGLGYGIFEVVPESQIETFKSEYGVE